MQGTIDANLTTIPLENLIALFIGLIVLLIVAALVFVFIVRRTGIKNIGTIQLEQRGQSMFHSMNEANKASDDSCRRQIQEITENIKIHISNIFSETDICPLSRVALSMAIVQPLNQSTNNNHYTTELMPDHYDSYRNRIIDKIRDAYISLSSYSKEVCSSREKLPTWDEVKPQLYECIDSWFKRVCGEVLRCCEKKLKIYNKFLKDFEISKDQYRIEIIKQVIEKNERYCRELNKKI